ncbi:hypothetical protein D0Z07_7847 [Hyphodiscus hymeniophilus]|uniref:NmrA-like domain-containing protein n=1 Tax=Hyphodiscus hymeniophilus TaxID=353542 RepID=A0A9P6SNA1_9HELO|nr:hypothetical protein D0Z07_7847 [Hyphodiscus hymeniophilus]
MGTRKYLVVGATGKQGGSVVSALQSLSPSFPIHIFALTRSVSSPRAQSLAADPNVSVIAGDPSTLETVFSQIGTGIDGVFCMTVPGQKAREEDQAKAFIDASIKYRVKHFVFTSGDRGGPGKSDNNPTNVPNLKSKHAIEVYLKAQAEGRMAWTILRPTTFMDMLSTDTHGKGFGRLWAGLGEKPLQIISTRDIGHFGAEALLKPDQYNGKARSIAGDELSFEEASKIFQEETGHQMPLAPCIVGSGLKLLVGDLGAMFGWLRTDGYGVDITGLRKEYPGLQTFRQWIQESSGWRKH